MGIPKGRYCCEAIGVPPNSLLRFLTSKEPEALPYKGLTLLHAVHKDGYTVSLIPLDLQMSFWANKSRLGSLPTVLFN